MNVVKKTRNSSLNPDEPIFKTVFGEAWDAMPPVMKKHYAIRPYSDDVVTVKGTLDISISRFVSIASRITGMLLSRSGKNIPVTVHFRSDKAGAFCFERTFHFPDKEMTFLSRMEWVKDNVLEEFMGYGIGWKLAYEWDGEKVILRHRGYVWRIFGWMIPVPSILMLGEGHAEEIPLSEDSFRMWTHAMHPLFGKMFGYAGEFKVTEMQCSLS